ncbi:hypothetical protein DM01DRAFT_1336200 [Hesseltinella vesiculosa]|uniref:tRNA/rRNA methyltransferase SpoU type domain-containing protein n=1 Tax=Hesseltinella vesiculosa TaxID=101127 RepID=A0A1X2GIF5_9FUNG|nr:hypothetical protein DM01DRAFT_1336200 [Hesseltinella vesiculosa]
MATRPSKFMFPSIFKRLSSQQNPQVKHFISLRESKHYRLENRSVLVQGMKQIRELRDEGLKIRSMVVTAEDNPYGPDAIKAPANTILQYPESFPAEKRYLTNVDLTRRILSTASRPSRHEVFAEIDIPNHDLPPPPISLNHVDLEQNPIDRMLVVNHINDPGNLGTLVRTGMGLGWNYGVMTSHTCDLYNDKTTRASRAMNLRWKYEVVPMSQLTRFLRIHGMTPIVADMLPPSKANWKHMWSPVFGDYPDFIHRLLYEKSTELRKRHWLGSGVWLWNFGDKKKQLPSRPALILSSEHQGVKGLDDELRISLPMTDTVESLNVAGVGGILMNEMNRLLAASALTA